MLDVNTKRQYNYLMSNLPTIELCLYINELSIVDFIMYLQYNVPFEHKSEIYRKLINNPEFQGKVYRGNPKENLNTLKHFMNIISGYLHMINKNDNKALSVYKDTLIKCDKIKTKVDETLYNYLDMAH